MLFFFFVCNTVAFVFHTYVIKNLIVVDISISLSLSLSLSVAPIPDVTLTSTVYRIPSHPDYNTLILTCSDTLPIADNDELAFDKQYTWTHDGANVSYSVTGPSNLKAKQSVSRLEASLTTPGEVVFKCIVSISIPGDPVVSRNKSVAITVLGKEEGEGFTETEGEGRSMYMYNACTRLS